jgi:hypothetical protein
VLVELLRENRQEKKCTWLWEAVHSTTRTNDSSSNRIATTYIHSHTSSCCCNSTRSLGCNWVHKIARKLLLVHKWRPSLSLSLSPSLRVCYVPQ